MFPFAPPGANVPSAPAAPASLAGLRWQRAPPPGQMAAPRIHGSLGVASPAYGQPDPSVVVPASLGLQAARLTLEQYACLAAELAVSPANAAQVRQRYGLDDTAHLAEQGLWQRRFSLDSQLFASYSSLFQQYRDWLNQQPRR